MQFEYGCDFVYSAFICYNDGGQTVDGHKASSMTEAATGPPTVHSVAAGTKLVDLIWSQQQDWRWPVDGSKPSIT